MLVCKKILIFCAFACCGTLFAQNIQNPVLPGVADAGVMKYNGKYYIGGVFTNGDFYVSDDLVHWGKPVHVVTMDNGWSKGSGAGNEQIHANDMFCLNGDFHLYWSVNYWGKDKHAVHIVHAQSKNVLGPYIEPDKKTWMDNRIDPKVFKDDDGQLYMYMVRFTDGNTIWGRKMKNPAEFAGEPVCLFASLPDTWETMDNRVAEGPWVMKYRNRYYLMYNANHTSTEWGNYQLGVAEADSPLSFQNGNKYSYPVVNSNQILLEENYVDLLRYGITYEPLFDYTENNPGVGWMLPVYQASDWKKGECGFSSKEIKGSTTRHLGTWWTSPSLWLRKSFFVGKQVGNLALRVAHDGDTKIYLNGTLIYEKQGRDYCMVNLDEKQRELLKKGENLLAVETNKGRAQFFDVSLFDMRSETADDILMTPGQPNILRGPNGFEWWLIYMANKNNECRGQYINRVHFFNKTLFVEGITGPCTDGYHPEPSLPTFSMKGETPSFGVLQQVKPSTTYMFETAVKTDGDAGIIAWWKDVDNNAYIGFDTKNHNWYLRTIINGKEKEEYFTLPKDFRWGVYHHLRIERNQDCLKVWLDEIPSPQKHLFTKIIPVTEPGVPGVFDRTKKALFEGVTYTIGFDDDRIQLKEHSEILKGDFLDHYEFSFQLSGLSDCKMSGSYPVYVDKDNYVKAQFNGITRMLEVVVVKQGQQILDKKYPLEHLQMVYPDVKYTDFVEKCYRFISPSWINALYLNRHEVGNKAEFVDDMFSKFTIEYLNEGEWYPLNNSGATVAEHPAYNRLSFTPIKTEGISFQLSGLSDCKMSGSYPVYVDKDNYVKAQFNGITRMLEVVVVKQGQQILDKKYPLEHLQMVYPDVKYTDFVEKCYRFISPSWINALYLNRHEVGNKAEFVDDMFSKFTIEYLNEGEWYPLNNSGATVAEHPAYNRLSFTPIKTEGIRFINKDAQDLERHIYKLGIQEQLKESYNFRAVRRGNKLYLFVDGRELGRLDIHYPASCVGFCSGNYSPVYKGILYYHIGN